MRSASSAFPLQSCTAWSLTKMGSSAYYILAIIFALILSAFALPVSHNEHHQHIDHEDDDHRSNNSSDVTTPASTETASAGLTGSTKLQVNEGNGQTESEVQQIPIDNAQSKSTFVYDYDPADYPADTTGTLLDSDSQVMSWGPEAEMSDYQDDYTFYPDEPSFNQKGNEESEPDYFTDFEDYNEQGPSFQKLILLAAARHRHRAYRVPPGDVTIVLRGS